MLRFWHERMYGGLCISAEFAYGKDGEHGIHFQVNLGMWHRRIAISVFRF